MKPAAWLLAATLALAVSPAFAAPDPVGYTAPDGVNAIAVTPQRPLPVGQKPGPQTPLGYQQITALASAAALTPPAGATVAYVTVEGQAVRWRDDGTAPTASVGNPVPANAQLVYSGNLAAIQFIQQTASAIIDVSYYQ